MIDRMKRTWPVLLVWLLLAAPAAVQAQAGSGSNFDYTINPGATNTITITEYTGTNTVVAIPTSINNLLVTCIGDGGGSVFTDTGVTSVTIPVGVTLINAGAFIECFTLTSVTIPSSVTVIGACAFQYCSLTNVIIPASVTNIYEFAFHGCPLFSVFFTGNAPPVNPSVFVFPKVYYLSGTTGWANFNLNTGLATILWNPIIQASGSSFGLSNNQFGFNITGTANIPILVEACTNLASPVWTPLQTSTLTNGSFYFSDPQWTNYPARYYGLGFP